MIDGKVLPSRKAPLHKGLFGSVVGMPIGTLPRSTPPNPTETNGIGSTPVDPPSHRWHGPTAPFHPDDRHR
jgi:hypothetical protein